MVRHYYDRRGRTLNPYFSGTSLEISSRLHLFILTPANSQKLPQRANTLLQLLVEFLLA
jgi:hypothetical protein